LAAAALNAWNIPVNSPGAGCAAAQSRRVAVASPAWPLAHRIGLALVRATPYPGKRGRAAFPPYGVAGGAGKSRSFPFQVRQSVRAARWPRTESLVISNFEQIGAAGRLRMHECSRRIRMQPRLLATNKNTL